MASKLRSLPLILIVCIVIGFIVTIKIARYKVQQNSKQTSYELGMYDIKEIANKMKAEGRIIPLYQIYLKNNSLQRYVSYSNKKKHNKAVYWDSIKNQKDFFEGKQFVVTEEQFYELCSYIIEAIGEDIVIYDKYNPEVRIKFRLPNKQLNTE